MFEALLTTDLARGLERQVVALRAAAGDPMLPIRVVVPTHLLGVALSRALFAGAGHVGIHFLLAEELAWFIAAPGALALGRTIIPEGADLALVIGAAADAVAAPATPEYLRAAAATAGFIRHSRRVRLSTAVMRRVYSVARATSNAGDR